MTAQITRTQYKQARRLLRDNGKYALRWLEPEARQVMEMVVNNKDAIDPLQVRAAEIAIWKDFDNGRTPAQTRDAALLLKDRHQFERSHLKEALAEFDRERAQAQRMNGVA